MSTRRKFLINTSLSTAGILIGNKIIKASTWNTKGLSKVGAAPLVISTWNHGIPANEVAWDIINEGGSALDAVEKGVMIVEADPSGMSVGYGGLPDEDGHVTLDACIMDHEGNAGSVCYMEDIMHPISVARLVMETTPHVMLAGDGAREFALDNGFQKQNLLTKKSKEAWKKWKKENGKFESVANAENHDTIGLLAIDESGNIAGACTTSGMAYKIPGRVGDSPIIGAGLYVDGDVGGAVATGHGEYVMKTLGSFLIVELMRNGMGPQQACEEATSRVNEKAKGHDEVQVGFLAVNMDGEYGAFGLKKGFTYALCTEGINEMYKSKYMAEWK